MNRAKLKQVIYTFLLSVLVIFCFGAAGEICGSFFETTVDAFESKFPDNRSGDINTVLSNLSKIDRSSSINNSSGDPLALMVVNETPRAIVAWNIKTGNELWKIAPPVSSKLSLNEDVFVFQSGYKVAGYNVQNGKRLWDFPIDEGWDYYGAVVHDDIAVVTLGVGGSETGGYANGRVLAVDARTGKKRWDNISGSGLLGLPSAIGEYVFIPWNRKRIVVLDLKNGTEVCRIRADDFTINSVEANAAGVFYGTDPTEEFRAALFKLNKTSASGNRAETTSFQPDLSPLPGAPSFANDAFQKSHPGTNASEKIRFHWLANPAASGVGMTNDTYYLHYWRYIIAFDANTNQVKWSYQSAVDLEALQVVPDGLFTLASDGRLSFVESETGGETWVQETKYLPLSAAFDVLSFTPKESQSSTPVNPRIGLHTLIRDGDNRMLPIRIYATSLLAALPEPEVTNDLLAIYSDSNIPTSLRKAVVKALKARNSGSEYLVNALHMRYDFLEQTQAPPMAVIAPALVNMKDKTSVPGLLNHLINYETPIEDLEAVADAINTLGDPSVLGTLIHFLTLYHADSSFIGQEESLVRVAEGILKFGTKNEEAFVATIRDDPQTLPKLKERLLDTLDPNAAAKAEEKAQELARTKAEKKALAEAEEKARAAALSEANRPYTLSRNQINKTIADNARLLRPCIKNALKLRLNLTSVRMKFTITGATGKASQLQILPGDIPNLHTCLENGLSQITFPLFKNVRQSASYTVTIKSQPRPRAQPETVYDAPSAPTQTSAPKGYVPPKANEGPSPVESSFK